MLIGVRVLQLSGPDVTYFEQYEWNQCFQIGESFFQIDTCFISDIFRKSRSIISLISYDPFISGFIQSKVPTKLYKKINLNFHEYNDSIIPEHLYEPNSVIP